MSLMLKLSAIAPIKRSDYIRGKLDEKNLDRLRAVRDGGRDWPFPAVEVRKLEKPVKVKGVEYAYRIVDGEHRRFLRAETKHTDILATVVKLSNVDADIRMLESSINGSLLLDKKKRGRWVKRLVKDYKLKVPAIAKRLHLTPRSIFRMLQDSAGLNRAKKRSGGKKSKGPAAPAAKGWTPEAFFTALAALTKDARKHAEDVQTFYRNHKDTVAPHVDPLLEILQ